MRTAADILSPPEGRGSLVACRAADAAVQWLLGHCDEPAFLRSIAEAVQWLDDVKARNHMLQERVGLNSLADWRRDAQGRIVHREGRFFTIIGIRVSSPAREVASWSQPILNNAGTGIIGMLVKEEQGVASFLVQAKAEVGNRQAVQLAPTVQLTQENYADSPQLKKPFLFDEFSSPGVFPLIRESRQSEEGARFYREQQVHRILRLPERYELDLPPDFRWMTANELRYFLHCGEQVNSCCRSILACLL